MGNPSKITFSGIKWIEETSKFNDDCDKNCNEDNDVGYFLEVDFHRPGEVHDLHNNLKFLPERMKIEKVEKLLENLDDKKEYVIHVRKLKQALKHGLALKKCVISKKQIFKPIGKNKKFFWLLKHLCFLI